jgi:hypothetical protein
MPELEAPQNPRHQRDLASMHIVSLIAGVLASAIAVPALAAPAKIIVLRHGEKHNAWELCATGQARAAGLVNTYLGKGAAESLFAAGEAPAAIFAITPHTLELVAPSAASWSMPVSIFPVLPAPHQSKQEEAVLLNQQTRTAAAAVLNDPRWTGKTVVMAWEHDHIANAKLEQRFAPEQVTLRQLLGLGGFADVPATWPGENYDYFWIVEFAPGSSAPSSFRMQRQIFPAAAGVPSNDWGAAQKLPDACIK